MRNLTRSADRLSPMAARSERRRRRAAREGVDTEAMERSRRFPILRGLIFLWMLAESRVR